MINLRCNKEKENLPLDENKKDFLFRSLEEESTLRANKISIAD